ncbi:Meiotic recombination protein SPO11-2 [Ceratocystis lukuohia]|uniref:DNA topoisomerase (ATP-hydrolyzing) n=1 Tax=Ceratocystis lukuohia TaxID=2019550 RepID=A0ABR4MDD0_9PEZI
MPTLFTSQKQVDEIVDRVSRTLRVNRSDLGIVAAGKGLASGALAVQTAAGSTVDFSQNAKATFRTLAADRFWKTASVAPGLLVTGKGYPDLSTRCFLRWIHNIRPDIPMLALTDFDPDGARIFFCYKSGSKTLSHETSATLPNLQWLGIREQHLQALTSSNEDNDPSSNSRTRQSQLLSMSTRDRCCAACMLVKLSNSAHTDAQALEYMSQIQMMLMLGVKAEIQMLNENGSIATWLDDQLVQYFRESCN